MTTWYAQEAGQAEEIIWSDQPSAGDPYAWADQLNTDTLDANGYAVTFETDSWTRAALVTAQAGGSFTISVASANRSFTAHIGRTAKDSQATVLLTSGDGHTLGITGNVYGGSGAADYGLDPVSMNGALITVTGSVYGGGNATAYGISRMDNVGSLTVTGLAEAGTGPAIQAGYQQTTTIGSAKAANGVPAIIAYSNYYTLITGGTLECSADGTFPLQCTSSGVRIRLTGTASGQQMKMYDNSGTPVQKILYVPDYPAEADVETGVKYDYLTKTGTLAAGGGVFMPCPRQIGV